AERAAFGWFGMSVRRAQRSVSPIAHGRVHPGRGRLTTSTAQRSAPHSERSARAAERFPYRTRTGSPRPWAFDDVYRGAERAAFGAFGMKRSARAAERFPCRP